MTPYIFPVILTATPKKKERVDASPSQYPMVCLSGFRCMSRNSENPHLDILTSTISPNTSIFSEIFLICS